MRALDNFRYANWVIVLNRIAQALAGLLLIFLINYASSQYFRRYDLTENRRYSLSPETRSYLRELQQPVRITVTLNPDAEAPELRRLYRETELLLHEYAHESKRGEGAPIEVEFINVFREQQRAEVLARSYQLSESEVVILDNGVRQQVLLPTDLVRIENGELSAYIGERAVTSALLELSEIDPYTLYFVTGHGEMSPEGVSPERGLSILSESLRSRNYEIEPLELSAAGSIPEDADALILASPQGPLHPIEVEMLRRYVADEAGRLLVTLDPLVDAGVDRLLDDWAIRTEDMVVLDPGPDFQSSSGDLIIRVFETHPTTDFLITNQLSVRTPASRPVLVDPEARPDDRRSVSTLLYSSPESWAEREYREVDDIRFDENIDLPGPVPMAVASERRVPSSLGIDLPGGKLIVFGNGGQFANRRIESIGNFMLFQNTLQWLLDREELTAIPERPLTEVQLTLSQSDIVNVGLRLLLLPGGVALLGLLVFAVRKT